MVLVEKGPTEDLPESSFAEWADLRHSLERLWPRNFSTTKAASFEDPTSEQQQLIKFLQSYRQQAEKLMLEDAKKEAPQEEQNIETQEEKESQFLDIYSLLELASISAVMVWSSVCHALPHFGASSGALVGWIIALAAALSGLLVRTVVQRKQYFLSALWVLDTTVLAVLCSACVVFYLVPELAPVNLLLYRSGVMAAAIGLASRYVTGWCMDCANPQQQQQFANMKFVLWGLLVAGLGTTLLEGCQILFIVPQTAFAPEPMDSGWSLAIYLVYDIWLIALILGFVRLTWYCTSPHKSPTDNSPSDHCSRCTEALREQVLTKLEVCEAHVLVDLKDTAISHLQELMTGKDRMLMTMSHELRTPIAGITGSMKLLESMCPTRDQAELLEAVSRCAGMLHYQVTQVLDYGSLMSGKMKLDIDDINLLNIMEETMLMINFEPKGKELCPTLLFDRDVPLDIRIDGHRWQQILINLLNNATKFTADGGDICAHVRLATKDECEWLEESSSSSHSQGSVNSLKQGRSPSTRSNIVRTFRNSLSSISSGLRYSKMPKPSVSELPNVVTSGSLQSTASTFISESQSAEDRMFASFDSCILVCDVIDTGIGIPLDKQSKVFEPFQQADESTSRKFGGTGLGLTICKKMATMMSGDIKVASPAAMPGQPKGSIGTKFSVLLRAEVVKQLSRSPTYICWPLGFKLLLALGNSLTRMQIIQMLKAHGVAWSEDLSGLHSMASAESHEALLFDTYHPECEAFQRMVDMHHRFAMVGSKQMKYTSSTTYPILALPVVTKALKEWLREMAGRTDLKRQPSADLGHASTAVSPTLERSNKVLLVAEDTAVNQLLIRKQLERLGCQALICETGHEVPALAPLPLGQSAVVPT